MYVVINLDYTEWGCRVHMKGKSICGKVWLELDDGKTVHLFAGDIVIQPRTRHGWRNKGERPATIAFVMLGAAAAEDRSQSTMIFWPP